MNHHASPHPPPAPWPLHWPFHRPFHRPFNWGRRPRVAVAVAALLALLGLGVLAADHAEAPGTRADPEADIADLYAWHDGDKLVAVLTYAGLQAPAAGQQGSYDADVLYGVHLDRDSDQSADVDVWIRFGQNSEGAWGVRVENLPGATGPVVGAVDQMIDAGTNASVYAGLRDDPFFFDLDGFRQTLDTGTLAFDAQRDSFAGLNVTAIVLEMDLAAATGDSESLQLWATTGRK